MNSAWLTLDFPSTAAGTDDDFSVAVPGIGSFRVTAAYWSPDTAAALDGTNFATITLASNDGAAGAFTALGTLTTETVAMAKGTTRAITLTGDGRYVSQGDVLRLAKTEDGTGALIHGHLTIVLEARPD